MARKGPLLKEDVWVGIPGQLGAGKLRCLRGDMRGSGSALRFTRFLSNSNAAWRL